MDTTSLKQINDEDCQILDEKAQEKARIQKRTIIRSYINRMNYDTKIQFILEKLKDMFPEDKIKIILLDDNPRKRINGDLIISVMPVINKFEHREQYFMTRFDPWWQKYRMKNKLYNICVTCWVDREGNVIE